MAKVVTQNDLYEIVKSNVGFISDITNIINNVVGSASNILGLIDRFRQVTTSVYGEDGTGGMVGQIITINENLNESAPTKLLPGRKKMIEFQLEEILTITKTMRRIARRAWMLKDEKIRRISDVISYTKNIIDFFNDLKFAPTASIKLELYNSTLDKLKEDIIPNLMWISLKTILVQKNGLLKLSDIIIPSLEVIFNKINEIKFRPIKTKIRLKNISEILESIREVINELFQISINMFIKGILIKKQMKLIKTTFKLLSDIINYVEDFDLIDTTSRKFKLLSKYTTWIFRINHKVVTRVSLINIKDILGALIKLPLILTEFILLHSILYFVNKTKIFMLINKLKSISKSIVWIFDIINKVLDFIVLYNLTELVKSIIKLILIRKIFKILAGTLAFAALAGLASIPFLILSVPLYLSVAALIMITRLLIVFANTISARTAIKLLLIIGVITAISMIGLEMFLLALVAKQVIDNYKYILLLLLGLIPIIGLMIVLGVVAVTVAVVATPAIVGMFGIAAMITATILIALQLNLLSKIDLDKAAIQNNIDIILSSALSIINKLFGNDEARGDLNNASKAKSWFGAFMGIFVANKIMLEAILSSFIMIMTFVSVTMILLIAVELKLLQSEAIKLDKSKVLSAVDGVMLTARFIIDGIFGRKYYDSETEMIKSNPNYENKGFITRVFGGVGDLITAVAGSVMLMSTFLSVGAMFLMVGMLRKIQEMEFNESKIKENIQKIINIAKSVIDVVNAPSDTKEKNKDNGILGKLLDFVLPSNLKYAIDALITMPFLAFTWVSIGMVKKIAEALVTIEQLPTLNNVGTNTKRIINACETVITTINNAELDNKDIENKIKSTQNLKKLIKNVLSIVKIDSGEIGNFSSNIDIVTSALSSITTKLIPIMNDIPHIKNDKYVHNNISSLNNLMKQVQKLAGLSTSDISNGLKNYIAIVDNIVIYTENKIFKKKNYKASLDTIYKYSSLLKAMTSMTDNHITDFSGVDVEKHGKFIDNNIKFLDKIGSVELKNIKQTTKMFEQMAKFSKSINGNFEGLAESLNEKIAPILEELKEIMEKVPDKLETGFSNTSRSIAVASTGAPLNQNAMTQQVQRENPGMSKEEVNKLVNTRLNEQAKNQNQTLGAKLDELIELLQGAGKINVVPV